MSSTSYEPTRKTLTALDDLRARIVGGKVGRRSLLRERILVRYRVDSLAVGWILDSLRGEGLIETRMGKGSRVITQAGPIWSKLPEGLTAVQFIERMVRSRIADGTYAVGSRLPSIDVLGAEFSFAPNTVAKGFRPLRRDGLIEYRRGLGSFVLAKSVGNDHGFAGAG
ncbi:GntR family transcriptional regulator [Streptomyces sp. NPDC056987]|uniref:GntR family transcriptional regulator n=1 Tax=Streptomyces sp. NPDC056987 TaxID=3345988 RepID=UPI003631FF01